MTRALTCAETQSYLRRLIGVRRGNEVCVSACVEFGADGGGILRTSWQRSTNDHDDRHYEFETPTELAMLVRLGKVPPGGL